MTLDEAKAALKKIANGRLAAIAKGGKTAKVPPDVQTKLAGIDNISDAAVLWATAKDMLQNLTAVMADQGCCTYKVGVQDFRLTMTQAECDMTPLPHSFDPTPCP